MDQDDGRLGGATAPSTVSTPDGPLEDGPIPVCYLDTDDGGDTAAQTATWLERRRDRLSVTVETDAGAAIEAVEAGSVDCLVFGPTMAAETVLSLLESVRNRASRLPVVCYTDADTDESFVRELLAVEGADCVRTGGGGREILAARIVNAAVRYRAQTTATALEARRRISRRLTRHTLQSTIDPGPIAADNDGNGVVTTVREALLEHDPVARIEVATYDETTGTLEVLTTGGTETTDDGSVLEACHDATCDVLVDAIRTDRPVTVEAGDDVRRVPAGIDLEADDRLTVHSTAVGERRHVLVAAVTTARRGIGPPFLSEVGPEIAHAISAIRLKVDCRRFHNAVEHAGHVVLITDDDGEIEYVNPAFESVTGYEREEAIGRTPSILQSGEHDDSFYEDLWKTIRAGEVWRGEVINERKDGTRYVINQTVAPIEDDRGETVGFVGINQDITDRKRRERDLAFLKRAVDQVGIGIGTYGTDGTFGYVNDRFAELLGTSVDELRDRHVADVTPALDRNEFDRYWGSFEEGETRVQETRLRRLDTAEELPVEAVTSHITVDDDPYQVGTVRDITDRKRRERELRRFRSAVEHAGHGVIITDRDGRIEYVNEAFEEMSGYEASEAVGRTPAILNSGEHDESFYEDLWETILDGDVWRGEIANERADGTRYVVDQTIAPITDDSDDDPVGFVGINQDITELKNYERELERQNERLGEYGRMVAHDLRNPLTLLEAQLEQLRRHLDADPDTPLASIGPAIRSDVGELEEIAEYMRRLIDDLLSMAEQGRLVLEAEETSLESVSREAWREVGDRDAELVVEDGRVEADPERLRGLLSNLFRNSVEHGSTSSRPQADDSVAHGSTNGEPVGDPSVTVRAGPLAFDDGFFVADDGPGIPEDERDRVLERGYTTAEEGTGFGLAIVSRIADAHEWNLVVTESEDGGARFEFREQS